MFRIQVVESSCSITWLAKPPKVQFTELNEQFHGKHNKVSRHDGTTIIYINKINHFYYINYDII
jgi:hypothetical protein